MERGFLAIATVSTSMPLRPAHGHRRDAPHSGKRRGRKTVPVARQPLLLSGKYNIEGMNASDMARALGRRGGRARGKRLSAAERKRIASLGAKARLQSLQAAGRIADNFRYAAALGGLRGRPTAIRRLSTFAGPLPGIYPAGS